VSQDPATQPEGLDLSDTRRRVVTKWADGKTTEVGYRALRLACRCAGCIEEMTGRPILDPATIPETIGIVAAEPVGLYGIRFDWSDGHNTGIYTWERLREASTPV
jgi:DUF971 family protein